MSEPFIGEIKMFGGNFAPRGYALCDGQLLPISQNTALFSILGTTYGGDGRTTFGLPDLRGRVAVHAGNGPGLTSRRLGEKLGQERVTLTTVEMPSHTHTVIAETKINVSNAVGTENTPGNNFISADAMSFSDTGSSGRGEANLDGVDTEITIGGTGGSQPHYNMQPYTVVNYIIALQGTFPSRS